MSSIGVVSSLREGGKPFIFPLLSGVEEKGRKRGKERDVTYVEARPQPAPARKIWPSVGCCRG